MLNTQRIKQDFPIFKNNPDLVYLDSSATSLKPASVINKLIEYYEKYTANIARGVHKMAEHATEEYEKTREVVVAFINAKTKNEVIFTRNTTESLNLVAYSLGRKIIGKNDEILTTVMEHHSNFVPWQVLAVENNAVFKVIDINGSGYLDLYLDKFKVQNSKLKIEIDNSKLEKVINKKTKILALTYVSNVLGIINPVKEIIRKAKAINPKIITIVDAAQAAANTKIDVQDLGCDFLAFSSHKMLGPTGVGVLWGKEDLLNKMFPFQFGGGMISDVSIEKTIFAEIPGKFEAGTPDIGGVVAFKEAVFYIQNLGFPEIQKHEKELLKYTIQTLKDNFHNKINILGPENIAEHAGLVSFTFNNFHPHDVAQILDEENIAVRTGYHCAMPLHKRLNIPSTTRASFYIYNDEKDIDKLVEGLKKVEKVLR